MRRAADWPSRLRAAVAAGEDRPFAWGSWDCCAAAATLVAGMTADVIDLTAPFTWSTRAGATRTMRGYLGAALDGDALLRATVSARMADLGLPVVATSRAQRGDPVLVEAATPWGPALALAVVDLSGRQALTGATPGGWQRLDRWAAAWRL